MNRTRTALAILAALAVAGFAQAQPAAPKAAAAITLCPQAWPRPGTASYSQLTITWGAPAAPARPVTAVGSP